MDKYKDVIMEALEQLRINNTDEAKDRAIRDALELVNEQTVKKEYSIHFESERGRPDYVEGDTWEKVLKEWGKEWDVAKVLGVIIRVKGSGNGNEPIGRYPEEEKDLMKEACESLGLK